MPEPVKPVDGLTEAPAAAVLLDRMLQSVFNEPDERRRATAIAAVFAEDVVFTDAETTVTGRTELTAKVTALLEQGPFKVDYNEFDWMLNDRH